MFNFLEYRTILYLFHSFYIHKGYDYIVIHANKMSAFDFSLVYILLEYNLFDLFLLIGNSG